MYWFLYDNGLRHERVKQQPNKMVKHTETIFGTVNHDLTLTKL